LITNDTWERLKDIYKDLSTQLNEFVCPILILTTIDDSDLDFLRSHVEEIYKNRHTCDYLNELQLLFAYLIVDTIYENYGDSEYGSGNYWSILDKLVGHTLSNDERNTIGDDFFDTLEQNGLRSVNEGKKKDRMNTILMQSSSMWYANGFFKLAYKTFNDFGGDLEYDHEKKVKKISEAYNTPGNVNQTGNAFAKLIKNEDLFVNIFEKILRKIDSNLKGECGEDIGRWEHAFEKWFKTLNSSSQHKSVIISLIEDYEGYGLNIHIPKMDIQSSIYRMIIQIGQEQPISLKMQVGTLRGRKFCAEENYIIPADGVRIFTGIRVVDSDSQEFINIPSCDGLFFKMGGEYVQSLSNSEYKVLTRAKDYNIPILGEINAGYGLKLIHTKLSTNIQYHVGADLLKVKPKIGGKVWFDLCPIIGSHLHSDIVDNLCIQHPIIHFSDIEGDVHVVLRNYLNDIIIDKIYTNCPESIDINEITSETGKYKLKAYIEGTSQFTKRYVMIRGLEYVPNTLVSASEEGQIISKSSGSEHLIYYGPDNQYVEDIQNVNGKNYTVMVRTPNIFFNLNPNDDNSWVNASSDDLKTIDFNNRFLIAPGCIPDGEVIKLIFRTDDMYFKEYLGVTESGICEFKIADFLEYVYENKCKFYLGLKYKDQTYPVFEINTLGKYVIERVNDILTIFPYSMPTNCKTFYKYLSSKHKVNDWLTLGDTVAFDVSGMVDLIIMEKNTDTNDELKLVSYSNLSRYLNQDEYDIDLDNLPLIEQARHYVVGDGCIQSISKALVIYNELADQGNTDILLYLAKMYIRGNIVDKNYEKAASYLLRFKIAKYGSEDKLFNESKELDEE